MLFVKRFLILPPVEADSSLALPDCEELNGVEQFCKNCETELHSSEPDVIQDICPHFIRASVLRRILFMQGDGSNRHSQLKCGENGAKQMGEHLTKHLFKLQHQ